MRRILKKVIAERGNAILDPSSAPILRALLSDISPNANRREISGLLIAVEEGVVLELIGLKNKRIDAAQYNSFLARIVTDRGIDRNFAEWILGEWIKALDKQLPGPQVLGSTFTEDDSTAPRIKGAAIRPAGASIVIDVNPKGALVNISGPNSFNKTGGASWKLDQLLPGTYKIVSSAESYEPDEQDIVIRPDASLNFSTTLKTLGSLSIKGSPTGAKLEVSGPASFSTVTGLPARIDGLYKGKYKISVTAKDYESEVRFADVEPEKMTSVSFNLLRRGTLEITGSPGGAKVDISGPANFKVSSGLPVTIDSAWTGDYSITVSRDGYVSMNYQAKVTPQHKTKIDVKLFLQRQYQKGEPAFCGRPRCILPDCIREFNPTSDALSDLYPGKEERKLICALGHGIPECLRITGFKAGRSAEYGTYGIPVIGGLNGDCIKNVVVTSGTNGKPEMVVVHKTNKGTAIISIHGNGSESIQHLPPGAGIFDLGDDHED